nr:hypothetical protein [Bacteroidales bacterium]
QNPSLALFSWMEKEEEGELSLSCKGWFDDCDNVVGILDTIRSARIQGKKVRVRGKVNEVPVTLTAKFTRIGETDYKQIRLITHKKKPEYVYNPSDYEEYNQQILNSDGTIDWQKGFVYREDGFEVFKIIVDDEVSKIGKLKDYLFSNVSENDEQGYKEEVDTKQILEDAKTATKIASKFTSGTACNICVRSALYIIKKDSALFPETGSGYNDPNNSFVLRIIKGYITPDGRAIDIKSDFDKLSVKPKLNERFVEICKTEHEDWVMYFQRLQNEADNGKIIIGVMLNSNGTVGHIMIITPGGLKKINEHEQTWGYSFVSRGIEKVPRVLECGHTDRENEAPLCRNVDRRGALERLKWYKYTK